MLRQQQPFFSFAYPVLLSNNVVLLWFLSRISPMVSGMFCVLTKLINTLSGGLETMARILKPVLTNVTGV